MGVCRSTDQSADLLSKAEGKMNAARSSEHKSEMGSWFGKKKDMLGEALFVPLEEVNVRLAREGNAWRCPR